MELCEAEGTTDNGKRWYCIRQDEHSGAHTDDHGQDRRLPGEVLQELLQRWGRTHKVAYTGTRTRPCPATARSDPVKAENDNQGYDPNRYTPDLDEHGQDTNRPLDDEETAALNRLDNGQGWLEQGRRFHRLHRPRTPDRHRT